MSRQRLPGSYVICLANRGYRSSLVVRKVYRTLPDPEACRHGLLRIVDESGDAYLFPRTLFQAVEPPDDLPERRATGPHRAAQRTPK